MPRRVTSSGLMVGLQHCFHLVSMCLSGFPANKPLQKDIEAHDAISIYSRSFRG
jgi:hypothetical protein